VRSSIATRQDLLNRTTIQRRPCHRAGHRPGDVPETLRRIGGFRHDANFDSWLYRLVVNACFDQKRKTRRLTQLVDGFLDFMHAPGGTALDEVLRAEMSDSVRVAVQSLPDEQRMVIVLRYTEGSFL